MHAQKTFQPLGRSGYQCPQCTSVCQVRNIPFENQKHWFFLLLGQGAHISEETLKSKQDFIGDVFCAGKFYSNREKCESFDGYVTTPRSIHACGKCGAWLFVHKVSFMLQEHVKTTKTDKLRFSLPKKNINLVPHKQLLPKVQFQSTKFRKKEMCVDNKVQ